MLLEELKHIKETKIGIVTALCTFEGRSHKLDEYMEDLKSAADAACTVTPVHLGITQVCVPPRARAQRARAARTAALRDAARALRLRAPAPRGESLSGARGTCTSSKSAIVEMAARVGGSLAAMEMMAKAAGSDAAMIASGHSRLFLSVKEVQWLLLESDVVVKQTVTKVLGEVEAISAASGVSAERLGIFFDLASEKDVESTAAMIDVDEVQKKEQKKHIGEVIKFFG